LIVNNLELTISCNELFLKIIVVATMTPFVIEVILTLDATQHNLLIAW